LANEKAILIVWLLKIIKKYSCFRAKIKQMVTLSMGKKINVWCKYSHEA
jgi:hypothetical protein